MATNPAIAYGRDVRCVSDADELWTEITGTDVVYQDALHRITTDDVLGPGGDGWGFDVRRLLGIPTSKLAAYQPVIVEVLQRDQRIASAEVKLTPTTTNGVVDVRIEVACTTTVGTSFTFIRNVSTITTDTFEQQAA